MIGLNAISYITPSKQVLRCRGGRLFNTDIEDRPLDVERRHSVISHCWSHSKTATGDSISGYAD